MKKCQCTPSKIAEILVIIGGLNWGLYGAGMLMGADWNLVDMLLGSWPMVEAIVYVLAGVSAIMMIFGCKCKKCKECMGDAPAAAPTAGAQM